MEGEALLIQALNVIHSPSASKNDRTQAYEICERAKTSPNAITLGVQLFLQNKEETVQHFGLDLLESSVKIHWNSYDNERKLQFKQFLLDTIDKSFGQWVVVSLKNKFIRVFVEITIREWPQKWPELFPFLFKLAQENESKNEILIIFLKTIGEELSSNEKLPKKRKEDLHNGLRNYLSQIFKQCYENIMKYFNVYKDSKDMQLQAIGKNIAKLSLRCLIPYFEWAPHKSIFEQKLGEMLCKLLRIRDFRMDAGESLLILLGRKSNKPEEIYEVILFPFQNLGDFIGSVQIATTVDNRHVVKENDDDEDDYDYSKLLTQVLTLLGVQYISNFSYAKEIVNFIDYLRLMIILLGHQSLLLLSYTVPFWYSLLRSPQVLECSEKITQYVKTEVYPQLVIFCFKKLRKVKFPDDDDDDEKLDAELKQINKYIDIDFSRSVFEDFFPTFLNEIGKIIASIAKAQPMIGLDYYLYIPMEISQITTIAQFLSFYIRNIEREHFSEQTIIEKMRMVIRKSLDVQVTNSNQLRLKLDLYDPFIPYFQYNYDDCILVFENVLQLVSTLSKMPLPNSNDTERFEFATTKKKSFNLLSKLSKNSQFLTRKFEEYMQIIIKILENDLPAGEKTILFEVLSSLSTVYTKLDQQMNFLNNLSAQYISKLNDSAFQSMLSNPGQFIQLIVNAAGLNVPSFAQVEYVLDIVFSLISILSNCKIPDSEEERVQGGYKGEGGIKYPTEQVLLQILPHIFVLIRCLLNVYVPGALPAVDNANELLDIDENIKCDVLKQSKIDYITIKIPIKRLQQKLTDIRSSSYRLLTLCFQQISPQILFSNSKIVEEIDHSIFNYFSHINYHQRKVLLRNFIYPSFKSLPASYFSLFEVIFKKFFALHSTHLITDWNIILNIKNNNAQNENNINNNSNSNNSNINSNSNNSNRSNNEIAEKIFENIVVDYTREFLESMNNLISINVENEKKVIISDLCRFWISKIEILSDFVNLLCCSIGFFDSNIQNHSAIILTFILPFLCKLKQYEELIVMTVVPIIFTNITKTVDGPLLDAQVNIIAILLAEDAIRNHPKFLEIFSRIPNTTPEILSKFFEENRTTTNRKIVKRNLKILLDDTIGINSIQKASKPNIKNHLEKVFVHSLKKVKNEQQDDSDDLTSVFK